MSDGEAALTLDFLNRAMKVQLPPNIVAEAGWKFDINALSTACGDLDLQKEVRLRFTSGGNKTGAGTLGGHRIKIDMEATPICFYHGITISQILTIDQGNLVLWHEMRHCWQAESYAARSGKAIDSFNAFYKANDGRHGAGYEQNVFEKDANAFAARMLAEGKMLLVPRTAR